jgi:hypothetical protein
MIVTVFRSRLHPDVQDEYMQWAGRMSELAKTRGRKSFYSECRIQVCTVHREHLLPKP